MNNNNIMASIELNSYKGELNRRLSLRGEHFFKFLVGIASTVIISKEFEGLFKSDKKTNSVVFNHDYCPQN